MQRSALPQTARQTILCSWLNNSTFQPNATYLLQLCHNLVSNGGIGLLGKYVEESGNDANDFHAAHLATG
jgi:hypothetical protein